MGKPHQQWNKGAKRRKHANRGSRERSWRPQIRLENQLAYRRRDEPDITDDECSCRCAHLYETECGELCSPYGQEKP